MKQAIPWSVKGVDSTARDAAKEAARRAGMTLGEWLNAVISETAVPEPEPAPRGRSRSRYEEEDDEAESPLSSLEERIARLGRRSSQTAIPRHSAGRPERTGDLAAVIERAVAESHRRAAAVEERTAGAMDSVVRFIERAEESRRDEVESIARAQEHTSVALREALDLVTTRLDSLQRAVQPGRNTDTQAMRDGLARLESRIEQVGTRAASAAAAPSPRIEQSLRELERRLADIAERIEDAEHRPAAEEPGRADRIARIEDKLGTILDALNGAEDDAYDPVAIDAVPGSLDEAIAQIRARQRDLEGGGRPRGGIGMRRQTEMLDGLRTDVASLALRLEQLGDQRPDTGIEALQRDLSSLARCVDGLAGRGDVSALEHAVRELAERVEMTREDGAREAVLRPVERLAGEVGRLVEELRPVAGLAGLRDDIAILADRLDRMPAQSLRPDIAETLLRQIAELRADAERAARPVPLDAIERQIAGLADRLDRIGAAGGHTDPRAEAALQRAVGEIRSAVDAVRPDDHVAKMEERFDALAARIEDIAVRASSGAGPDLTDLNRRLDSMSAAIERRSAPPTADLGDLNRRLDSIGAAIERRPVAAGTDLSDLTRRLDTLHDTLQRRPAGPTADLSGLESLVRSLAEKIEAARGPDADGRALDALERQIAAMAQTMDRSGEGFTALRSMERSIGDLFAKIEDAKRSTIHAAEQAAVKAASETVARTPGPQSPLAAAMADSKTRETLVAVQETLEKIVERLGMLESDMASDRVRMLDVAEKAVRAAPVPAAAAPVTPTAQKIAAAAAAAEAAKAILPRGAKAAEPTGAQSIAAMVRATASRALQDVTAADRALPAGASTGTAEMLLEPGSGRPGSQTAAFAQAPGTAPSGPSEPFDTLDLAEPAAPEPAPADAAPTSFIAAARKAAQAAQAVQAAAPKGRVPRDAAAAATKAKATATAATGDRLSPIEQMKAFVNTRRRPLLIGVAAVMLAALTASQLGALFGSDPEPMPPPARPAALSQPAPAQPAAGAPRTDAGAPAQAPAPAAPAAAPAPVKPQASLGSGSFSPSGPVQPGTNFAPVDPVSVGSIGRAPVAPASPAAGPDMVLPAADMPVGTLPRALQKAAAAGQPAAAFEIASRIADGRGVTRDAKLAAKWFERAAQQNVAAAQYRLGSLYEKGIGVTKDVALARSWYLKAAEQGNAKAMHNLGVIIADGAGAKPDYASAATWFRRAADHGVRDSQYNLAILTARGLGVEQNLTDSWVWFALAAQQGDEDAAKKRDEVGARLGTDTLTAARRSFESFRPRPQDPAANDVAAPAGGWDVEQPVVTDKPKSVRG